MRTNWERRSEYGRSEQPYHAMLTIEFGPNGTIESHGKGHAEDVDGDGDLGIVLHFKDAMDGDSVRQHHSCSHGRNS
jgi:hypothetical protein